MTLKDLPLLIFLAALGLTSGCGALEQQSPSGEVKAFFVAANEANFLGVQCLSPKQLDLSGYSHLVGVKYPPTLAVDVLQGPPPRPYQAFAVLETSAPAPGGTYDSHSLEGLKDKAKAIGADAIIFCGPQGGEVLPGLSNSSKLAAVAIKYRLEAAPNPTGNP